MPAISVHSFCASDAGLMFNAACQVNRPSELRNVLNAADGRGGQENSARRKGKLGEDEASFTCEGDIGVARAWAGQVRCSVQA